MVGQYRTVNQRLNRGWSVEDALGSLEGVRRAHSVSRQL